MNPLISALIQARNAQKHITYKQAKDLLGEKHMCRAFGRFNELATQYADATGDTDLFSYVRNSSEPGQGYLKWREKYKSFAANARRST